MQVFHDDNRKHLHNFLILSDSEGFPGPDIVSSKAV